MHAEIHTAHDVMKTYMLSLLFMVLHFLLCIKTNSTRATDKVLQACYGMINALKVNGKFALKMEYVE